jgi:Cu2+-containing amine oxidase
MMLKSCILVSLIKCLALARKHIKTLPAVVCHPQVCCFIQFRSTPLTSNMSTEQVLVSLPKKTASQHPLGPLTAAEISESARLTKGLWPSNTNIQFKSITLQEPKKAELVPFLAAEHSGQRTPTIDRKSFVIYYIRNTVSSA